MFFSCYEYGENPTKTRSISSILCVKFSNWLRFKTFSKRNRRSASYKIINRPKKKKKSNEIYIYISIYRSKVFCTQLISRFIQTARSFLFDRKRKQTKAANYGRTGHRTKINSKEIVLGWDLGRRQPNSCEGQREVKNTARRNPFIDDFYYKSESEYILQTLIYTMFYFISGWVSDVTGVWDLSFYLAGFWIVLSGVFIGLIPYTKNRLLWGAGQLEIERDSVRS